MLASLVPFSHQFLPQNALSLVLAVHNTDSKRTKIMRSTPSKMLANPDDFVFQDTVAHVLQRNSLTLVLVAIAITSNIIDIAIISTSITPPVYFGPLASYQSRRRKVSGLAEP